MPVPRINKPKDPSLYPKSPPTTTKTPKSRSHTPGRMNKTEEAFSEVLEAQKDAGTILGWWFEAITLQLAFDVRYTPDFVVQAPDGEIYFYDTKGAFVRNDSRIKMAFMASKFPFRITQAQGKYTKLNNKWTWEYKEFKFL